jgi:hypothetical protein
MSPKPAATSIARAILLRILLSCLTSPELASRPSVRRYHSRQRLRPVFLVGNQDRGQLQLGIIRLGFVRARQITGDRKMAPEIPEPFFFKSLVADLNHLVGDVTVLRRNRFSDEVARAG